MQELYPLLVSMPNFMLLPSWFISVLYKYVFTKKLQKWLSFIVVLGGDTLWLLLKLLQWIKYIILEFTPSTVFLYPPSPCIPRIVSMGIILYLHTCVHSIWTVFTLLPSFLHDLTPATCINHPPRQNLFCSPVLQFCKRKKKRK
jgi:hypothetical protein